MLKHGRRLRLLTFGRRFRGHRALVQNCLRPGLWPFPVTAPSCIDAVMAFASDWPRPSGRESVSKPGQDEFWQIYEDLWIVDAFLWQVRKRTESIFCKPRCCSHSLSHVRLFATPWTVAHQAPLSMGLSRQEYWSGLPFPPPGDASNPGIKSAPPMAPALAGGFFTTDPLILCKNR